jgi:hypothetical protein
MIVLLWVHQPEAKAHASPHFTAEMFRLTRTLDEGHGEIIFLPVLIVSKASQRSQAAHGNVSPVAGTVEGAVVVSE